MRLTPLQQVKKLYGSKDMLVGAVAQHFAPAEGESAEDFTKRLRRIANAKLLRLVQVGEAVKELGGREALVAKVAELRGHARDRDYLGKLSSFATPRLLDMYQSLQRRVRKSAPQS